MGLKIAYRFTFNGVKWKSGHFYNFKYSNYENDPSPVVIFINVIRGIHPKTKNQHRYIQAINTNYIPRKDRKRFVKSWKKEMTKTNNVKFTWEKVKSQYPYLKFAIRRYFIKPSYMIRQIEPIDFEHIDKEIVRSLFKDFSKTVKRKIASKIKSFFSGTRKSPKRKKKKRKV